MSALTLFEDVDAAKFITSYDCKIQLRHLIVGGVPSDASTIRKWLEARMNLDDPALQELLAQTIAERDAPMTVSEKVDVLMGSEQAPSVNGFKRDPITTELVYESRCLKAALKESCNSAYPGTNYPGKAGNDTLGARKGLMSTMAERVFIREPFLGLGVKEPTRIEERIKHVMTPKGPKSAISSVEVVDRPQITFTVHVHDDFLTREAWAKIWVRLEDIGIGADRGRSDGQFDLLEFTKREHTPPTSTSKATSKRTK